MSFNDVWHSDHEGDWNRLLKNYWSLLSVANIQVEYQLHRLSKTRISGMDADSWYRFLHDEYFVWKYTAKNRLATTRASLRKMYERTGGAADLERVRQAIIEIDTEDIGEAIRTVRRIDGLGVAGASGLLSLIYPESFATVDQFVVKALLEVQERRDEVLHMWPENLTIKDGVVLIEMMRAKASSMNEVFRTTFWTPRTIEMALWAYRGTSSSEPDSCR